MVHEDASISQLLTRKWKHLIGRDGNENVKLEGHDFYDKNYIYEIELIDREVGETFIKEKHYDNLLKVYGDLVGTFNFREREKVLDTFIFLDESETKPMTEASMRNKMKRGFGLGINYEITMEQVKKAREQRIILVKHQGKSGLQTYIDIHEMNMCFEHLLAGEPKIKKRDVKNGKGLNKYCYK